MTKQSTSETLPDPLKTRLTVDLTNCYGIGKLKKTFDFSGDGKVFSIYSPNGTMKTSFAKTFDQLSQSQKPKDAVFSDRKASYIVKVDGSNVNAESIFVVTPMHDQFKSEKANVLLANKGLRDKYRAIHDDIDKAKDILLKELKSPSGGLKPEEIESIFSDDLVAKNFYDALERVEVSVNQEPNGFKGIIYKKIFQEKTVEILEEEDIRKDIALYIEQYNKLIDDSQFFTKKSFNHYDAEEIAVQLNKHGFFSANHQVILNPKNPKNPGEHTEISSVQGLTDTIQQEKTKILSDPNLLELFNKIDDRLKIHAKLRDFRAYLANNPKVLSALDKPRQLKADLWISYLQDYKEDYQNVLDVYRKGRDELNKIREDAKKEAKTWGKVIDIYNNRFTVPYKVVIRNQVSAVLEGKVAKIAFDFYDTFDKEKNPERMDQDTIFHILSEGEKKALYILNIMFEVEVRKQSGQKTFFIIDDIADSFDYKNKYAILQYLKDISQKDYFYLIILTHNFDFYRSVNSKMSMPSSLHTLQVVKDDDRRVRLNGQLYSDPPFRGWMKNLFNDESLNNATIIASITFARNLAEYSGNDMAKDQLSQYLHIQENPQGLTIKNLKNILNGVFHNLSNVTWTNIEEDLNVLDLIYQTADKICLPSKNKDLLNLQDKIVLSIAARLKAEQFIISSIGYAALKKEFGEDYIQTYDLIDFFRKKWQEDPNLGTLDSVRLMTPSNIHINSFMFEPIVDTSIHYLISLYQDVCKMKKPQ